MVPYIGLSHLALFLKVWVLTNEPCVKTLELNECEARACLDSRVLCGGCLTDSESLGSPLSVPLPLPIPSASEPVYHSTSVTLPSLPPSSLGTVGSANPPSAAATAAASSSAASSSSSSAASSAPPPPSSSLSSLSSAVPSTASPFSSVGGSYDAPLPVHLRLPFSQSKEAPGSVMVSGSPGVPKRSVCVCVCV